MQKQERQSGQPIRSRCDFIARVGAHEQGCGCPTCAARQNSTGDDADIQEIIGKLRELAAQDRLIVWDPVSRQCVTAPDIDRICANGSFVQIGLRPDWPDIDVVDEAQFPEPRVLEEIEAAEEEFFEKLWYYRSKGCQDHETVIVSPPATAEIERSAEARRMEIENVYPAQELPPWSAYQYGEVCGKLSALRWVLGYDWDVLDT